MLSIRWTPAEKKPANGPALEKLIGDVLGDPLDVEILLALDEPSRCWRVQAKAHSHEYGGDDIWPLWSSHQANLARALAKAGLPVCSE